MPDTPAHPFQIAAIMALRHTEAAVEAQAAVYQGRRDVLCEGLERIGWPVERPKASMFVRRRFPVRRCSRWALHRGAHLPAIG